MKASTRSAGSNSKVPARLHHHAYTTDDHERTRQFYEEVIGLPLVAMYIEREHLGGDWVELGHAFYELADGSALAFFNFADPAKQEEWRAKQQSLFIHLSLSVDSAVQEQISARISNAKLETFTIEHGYCRSIYVRDPNGLLLEFTVDPPNVGEIKRSMAASAHADMKRWIEGNRASNNQWREVKETDAPT